MDIGTINVSFVNYISEKEAMEEATEQLLECPFHQHSALDEWTRWKGGVYESIEQCLVTL